MRLVAGFALLALLALAMAPPPASAKQPPSVDIGSGVAADGFTLVGHDLLYFDIEPGAWELRERDLERGGEHVLATIPYADGTSIHSLRANERWVVWLDDRAGGLSMYALDRATGSSSRVTQLAAAGGDLHLQGDRVAYERSAQLFTVTLPDGAPQPFDAGGQAFHPALTEEGAVFVRLVANGTEVVSWAPKREEAILEKTRGSYTNTVRSGNGTVAWLTGVLWNPDQPGHGFKGDVVQVAEGPLGPVRNLTAAPVKASSLLIEGGYVCWLEGDRARCHRWQDDAWLEATVHGTAIAASATHLAVFAGQEGRAVGSLVVRRWDAQAQPSSLIAAAPWPAAVAALGIAAASRRWP